MAKILRESSDPKFYDKFRLETCDPADDARIQAGKDWLKAEELAALEETRDGFLMEFRRSERPWRAEFLPHKLCMTKGKELPDYIGSFPGCSNKYSCGCIVSLRMKELIESRKSESDGWQFFPVEILHRDGENYGTYYIWWVHRLVDAVDPVSEGVKTVSGTADGKHRWTYIGERTPERLILKKPVINELTAWVDYRFYQGRWVFVSDALFDLMKEANYSFFKSDSEWSEA